MRGVISNEDLRTWATVSLISADLTTITDDGHLFPLFSAFFWPDESIGVIERLAEDVNGVPIQFEFTHISAGRKIILNIPEHSILRLLIGSIVTVGGLAHFDDVASMLASDTSTWTEALCRNYETGDGNISKWCKPADPSLVANGGDLLACADGTVILRYFYRPATA